MKLTKTGSEQSFDSGLENLNISTMTPGGLGCLLHIQRRRSLLLEA